MAIGIIDSGLGGYSIYHALHTAYPKAAFVFLADQAHAPYGNKQASEIIEIASRNMNWFLSQGITEVVIACNTMNAVALDTLKLTFPEITFHDVLGPTLKQLESTDIQDWLVVATQLTIQSQMYPQAIQANYPEMKVKSQALPRLVSLIEGLAEAPEIDAYLNETLSSDQLNQKGLILGCTHYPLALQSFKEVFKGEIIDSIQAMVTHFEGKVLQTGNAQCYTTKDASYAHHQVRQLFDVSVDFEKAMVD